MFACKNFGIILILIIACMDVRECSQSTLNYLKSFDNFLAAHSNHPHSESSISEGLEMVDAEKPSNKSGEMINRSSIESKRSMHTSPSSKSILADYLIRYFRAESPQSIREFLFPSSLQCKYI